MQKVKRENLSPLIVILLCRRRDLVSREYKGGREIAHLQPAIEIFWGNIYLQIIYDGNAGRKENGTKRNARPRNVREGTRKVETTPLLDYRTSVAAWALFEFPTTTLRAYCLVSTNLTLGPHPWATPTSESIYLRTFKASPPCTQRLRKLAGNWFHRPRFASSFRKE